MSVDKFKSPVEIEDELRVKRFRSTFERNLKQNNDPKAAFVMALYHTCDSRMPVVGRQALKNHISKVRREKS